jgi:hypothetical protein
MKSSRNLLVLTLVAIGLFSAPQSPPASACAGSTTSVCVVSQNSCLKTMVMAKAVNRVVVLQTNAPTPFNIPVNLFMACPTRTNCGTPCSGGTAAPTAASITIALFPFPLVQPLPPPVAAGFIGTATANMTLPSCTASGSFNTYSVSVTVPRGTPAGTYSVRGRATVSFSDATTLAQFGDTVVCLVDPAPGMPSVPRLDVELLTPNFVFSHPGDQSVPTYKITNNDPTKSVTVTAFGNSKQNAVRPSQGNEKQGVFSIANPFGDDFPIQFDPGSCIPLPDHPYTQPEILKPLPAIMPGQSTTIQIRIRSYGQCGSGSCSESTLRVSGTFSDGTPAKACAGMASYVDTSVPVATCTPRVDDCNNNNIPDALDIANGTSQDRNFNALPDECETNAPFIPNPVQVSPPVVTIPTELIALNLQSVSPLPATVPITNVWANGIPLTTTNGGQTWNGQIPSAADFGPQTVYALAKDSSGKITTHIGLYDVGQPTTAMVQFSNPTYSIQKGCDTASLTVNRSGDTSGTSTVDFVTIDHLALQRTDYTLSAGRVTFAPGETSKSFPILVTNHGYARGNQTLAVAFTSSFGASIGPLNAATVQILDSSMSDSPTSPIDDAATFVCQHYHDHLGRQGDSGGQNFWTQQITQCGSDPVCIRNKRIDVSNAFFFEQEFQDTGSFVIGVFEAAFGVNPQYTDFMPARSRVIGGSQLNQSKTDFTNDFVRRPDFMALYPSSMTPAQYVDALNANTGNSLTQSQRDALVNGLTGGTETRGSVLRKVAENSTFVDRLYNTAFVLAEYFDYLRRSPDQAGFDFWLGQVNRFPIRNVAAQHAMVCSFITSREFQERFSGVISHSNAECPQ